MTIERYKPQYEFKWDLDASGARDAVIETDEGVVFVFSFAGSEAHRAFTRLQMWIAPYRYDATIPRHYDDRWIRRVCRQFAWECSKRAEAEVPA